MRKLRFLLSAAACAASFLVIAGSALGQSEAEESEPKLRVGVYDSRVISLAYWQGDVQGKHHRLDRHHIALIERRDKAEASGDEKLAKKLDAELWAHRKLVHKQVFSTFPVDDVLEHYKDKLPEIAKGAGVGPLVSKWDKKQLDKYKSAEFVDVTELLVKEINPGALDAIKDFRKHKPLSLEEIERHMEAEDSRL